MDSYGRIQGLLDQRRIIEVEQGLRDSRFWYDDLEPVTQSVYRDIIVRYPELRKRVGLLSPTFFADYYLGVNLWEHQKRWAKHFLTTRRGIVQGPVDHGKTEVISKVLPLMQICGNRNIRILHFSGNVKLPKKNLYVSRKELERNRRLIADYGQFYNRKNWWTTTEVEVIRDQYWLKDFTIEAISSKGDPTGNRYDQIILDDPITHDNARTPTGRNEVYEKLEHTVFNRLEPDGSIHILGNPQAYDDSYMRWEHAGGWDILVDRAIIREPEHYEIVDLDEKDWIKRPDGTFEKRKCIIESEDWGECLCKEKWPMDRLLLRRHSTPRHLFGLAFQCDIESAEDDLFTRESLEASRDFNRSYVESIDETDAAKYAFIVAGTDPAIVTDKRTAEAHDTSYMVTYAWGVYPNGHADLLFFYHERGNTPKQVIAVTKKHDEDFKPAAHFWEANSFGAMQIWELKEETNVPIVAHQTTGQKHDYLSGVPSLSIMFENGYLSLPYMTPADKEKTDLIISEFMAIGKSTDVKSDVVMAMWITKSGADRWMKGVDKMRKLKSGSKA